VECIAWGERLKRPHAEALQVCTHSTSFVVVLELTREAFQDTLAASSVVTKVCVCVCVCSRGVQHVEN
jgi:hypothetical protein